jgi:hypothetical protein
MSSVHHSKYGMGYKVWFNADGKLGIHAGEVVGIRLTIERSGTKAEYNIGVKTPAGLQLHYYVDENLLFATQQEVYEWLNDQAQRVALAQETPEPKHP